MSAPGDRSDFQHLVAILEASRESVDEDYLRWARTMANGELGGYGEDEGGLRVFRGGDAIEEVDHVEENLVAEENTSSVNSVLTTLAEKEEVTQPAKQEEVLQPVPPSAVLEPSIRASEERRV